MEKLKPCGTEAAYRRHLRHGESPCGPCRRAAAKSKQRRRGAERQLRELIIAPSRPDFDPEQERIRRVEENLAIVDAALADATPREVPALSKRRSELEKDLWSLKFGKKAKGGGALDQLAARRAARAAAAAS